MPDETVAPAGPANSSRHAPVAGSRAGPAAGGAAELDPAAEPMPSTTVASPPSRDRTATPAAIVASTARTIAATIAAGPITRGSRTPAGMRRVRPRGGQPAARARGGGRTTAGPQRRDR